MKRGEFYISFEAFWHPPWHYPLVFTSDASEYCSVDETLLLISIIGRSAFSICASMPSNRGAASSFQDDVTKENTIFYLFGLSVRSFRLRLSVPLNQDNGFVLRILQQGCGINGSDVSAGFVSAQFHCPTLSACLDCSTQSYCNSRKKNKVTVAS